MLARQTSLTFLSPFITTQRKMITTYWTVVSTTSGWKISPRHNSMTISKHILNSGIVMLVHHDVNIGVTSLIVETFWFHKTFVNAKAVSLHLLDG